MLNDKALLKIINIVLKIPILLEYIITAVLSSTRAYINNPIFSMQIYCLFFNVYILLKKWVFIKIYYHSILPTAIIIVFFKCFIGSIVWVYYRI